MITKFKEILGEPRRLKGKVSFDKNNWVEIFFFDGYIQRYYDGFFFFNFTNSFFSSFFYIHFYYNYFFFFYLSCKNKKKTAAGLFPMINKPPRWNDQVGAYVLNFNGRVTMASVKNFQLIHPEEAERVVLQFGRVGKDKFTMDFMWPMTPAQAFGICLSSFDYKLACE